LATSPPTQEAIVEVGLFSGGELKYRLDGDDAEDLIDLPFKGDKDNISVCVINDILHAVWSQYGNVRYARWSLVTKTVTLQPATIFAGTQPKVACFDVTKMIVLYVSATNTMESRNSLDTGDNWSTPNTIDPETDIENVAISVSSVDTSQFTWANLQGAPALPDGSIVLMGELDEDLTIATESGDRVLTSASTFVRNNAWVARARIGSVVWAAHVTNPYFCRAEQAEVDPADGSIYVGYTAGIEASLPASPTSSIYNSDGSLYGTIVGPTDSNAFASAQGGAEIHQFVVKYDSDGNVLWAKSIIHDDTDLSGQGAAVNPRIRWAYLELDGSVLRCGVSHLAGGAGGLFFNIGVGESFPQTTTTPGGNTANQEGFVQWNLNTSDGTAVASSLSESNSFPASDQFMLGGAISAGLARGAAVDPATNRLFIAGRRSFNSTAGRFDRGGADIDVLPVTGFSSDESAFVAASDGLNNGLWARSITSISSGPVATDRFNMASIDIIPSGGLVAYFGGSAQIGGTNLDYFAHHDATGAEAGQFDPVGKTLGTMHRSALVRYDEDGVFQWGNASAGGIIGYVHVDEDNNCVYTLERSTDGIDDYRWGNGDPVNGEVTYNQPDRYNIALAKWNLTTGAFIWAAPIIPSSGASSVGASGLFVDSYGAVNVIAQHGWIATSGDDDNVIIPLNSSDQAFAAGTTITPAGNRQTVSLIRYNADGSLATPESVDIFGQDSGNPPTKPFDVRNFRVPR
jgi:hypothetical protein